MNEGLISKPQNNAPRPNWMITAAILQAQGSIMPKMSIICLAAGSVVPGRTGARNRTRKGGVVSGFGHWWDRHALAPR